MERGNTGGYYTSERYEKEGWTSSIFEFLYNNLAQLEFVGAKNSLAMKSLRSSSCWSAHQGESAITGHEDN